MQCLPYFCLQDLQAFMDDAPNGVILFSLGSVIDPKTILANGQFEIFLNVFRRLKQKIMWKVAAGMPEVKDPNIKLQTWFPQQEILNHNRTVLFITHGGLQSTVEAIANGVPCLGVPFFFDQKKDVSFLETVGMGRLLDFNNLTEKSLEWSIHEMLNNPESYAKLQTLTRTAKAEYQPDGGAAKGTHSLDRPTRVIKIEFTAVPRGRRIVS
ncbi:unnamed protein product [Nesidiocoris tenuis]|uniref:UDP-glucuronosyltransferase n=1 Tax=Nesidiocoris tenuis TaxID=355587 RepID=A0A6H5HS67_9HEMI|nr:unnamed protein product [Nesidiocoris tenuis]